MGGLKGVQLWTEQEFETVDSFGKPVSYDLDPGEFVLGTTYERMWIPRHLIAMVEGRSTYARFGVSMHQTAPWLQPGWNGHITLEICNNGKNKIELTPIKDKPCQVTFFRLTSEVPEDAAYGSRATDTFQNQTSALPTQRGKN
jgi:dCTP deaminase